jgi:hypothetical protein
MLCCLCPPCSGDLSLSLVDEGVVAAVEEEEEEPEADGRLLAATLRLVVRLYMSYDDKMMR